MAQLTYLDFLRAVERKYPEVLAAITEPDFDLERWSRDVLQIDPVPC